MALKSDVNLSDYGIYDIDHPLIVHITNQEGIVNLKSFSCFVIGREVIPAQREFSHVKIGKSFKRVITDVEDKDDELILNILFVGQTRSFINTNIRRLMSEIEQCKIKFNIDEYYFDSIISSYEMNFLTYKAAVVEVKLEAQAFTESESISIIKSGHFYIRGAKTTPLNYKITAIRKLTNFKVNDIVIKSLSPGKTIYIDSFNRKVVMDGNNAIDSVELFEFPEAKGNTEVTISDENVADVVLDYRARW